MIQFTKILMMICLAILVLLTGCGIIEEPIEITLPSKPAPAAAVDQSDKSMERRFTEPSDIAPGAVESALMWSQKYDEISVKTEKLMDKNTALIQKNSDLKHKVTKLELELEQTKKEIDQANTFLQEMHLELTQWKGDVLGFRDEMRKADTAQLHALSRILKILGAEMSEPASSESQQAPPKE